MRIERKRQVKRTESEWKAIIEKYEKSGEPNAVEVDQRTEYGQTQDILAHELDRFNDGRSTPSSNLAILL